jgi:DNA-binding FadR family transcriptional regulator
MAPEPVTSDRIYALFKREVMDGAYLPGEILIERRIADQFGVSISPIRGCAFRLVGERMLELNRGGGFRVPKICETALRDLYFWHGQLVRSAVTAREQQPALARDEPWGSAISLDFASQTKATFEQLAARSANGEIIAAIRSAGERLHAVRLREHTVLTGLAEELEAVGAVTETGSDQDLLRLVWAYHRRRLRRISELVTAMHRPLQR